MKLKDGFITHESDGEYVVVSAGGNGFNGMIRCNLTAGAIIELLKTETDETAVVEAMLAAYDASREEITAAVQSVLENLRRIGALDESH